jgi:DNA-binding transcriptional LysR family regulator
MTDLEIRYFLEIVNQGVSFTKAAQTLYVSQPALTKHINTLSKTLGVRLFDTRNKSAPVLTQEGKLFYQFFSECRERFDKTLREAKVIGAGELRFAGLTGWDMEALLPIKEYFTKTYSGINVSFVTCGFKTLKNGLLNDDFDLVVTMTEHFQGMPNISIHDFYRGTCFLVFSSSHPLAEKTDGGNLSISDFREDVFYILSGEEAPFLMQACEAYCKSKGFVPRFMQLPDLNSIIINLQTHSGYTIMDEWVYGKDYQKLKCIPLDLRFTVANVWKTNNTNKALRFFLETCVLNKK